MKKLRTYQKIILIIVPLLLPVAVYLIANLLADSSKYLPPCFSYTFLRVYCPGCGATRSVLALLDGNILLSIRQNPLVVFSILLYIWLYIELLFRLFFEKPPFTILKDKFLWWFLAVLVVWTVLRNIFPVLAPI